MLYGYFGLGFLASLSLIVLNDKDHFGMTEVTQDKTFELKAVVQAKMANMLLYHRWAMVPKKFIYITHQIKRNYKNRNGKRHKHSSKDAQKSTLVKNDEMVYQESWAKTLFGLADNDNQFAKQENTFNVASDWLVLSADQAKN